MNTTVPLTETATIDRRAKFSPADFRREYLHPNRPVVITDALAAWPAIKRWSPQFFKDRFGDRQVTVDGRTLPLGELIDWVMRSSKEDPAPYLRNEPLRELFPELVEDIHPIPEYLSPNWLGRRFSHPDVAPINRGAEIEIFIGGEGQSFPVLHYDGLYAHAFLMQIHGRKQYFVYPPDQTPFMYPLENDPNRSRVNNVETPDLEKFPLFAKARAITFTLNPGELLFVPGGWWHTVRMLSASITLSVNGANSSNWRNLSRDLVSQVYRIHPSRKKRLKLAAYMRYVGILNACADFLCSLT
jgi:ribosomal protein L16 Arg81 hydroxylase